MAAQKQDDQLERTFSSYVRIQDVVLKTYLGRWTIGRSGERGSGISVLPARYDDDDIATYRTVIWEKELSIQYTFHSVYEPCNLQKFCTTVVRPESERRRVRSPLTHHDNDCTLVKLPRKVSYQPRKRSQSLTRWAMPRRYWDILSWRHTVTLSDPPPSSRGAPRSNNREQPLSLTFEIMPYSISISYQRPLCNREKTFRTSRNSQ